ncbi:MAG TPA: hypothetical protein VFR27_00150 [Mycobacterium sp.]|nr:hypothetical protein [Mycobacterium sp.]
MLATRRGLAAVLAAALTLTAAAPAAAQPGAEPLQTGFAKLASTIPATVGIAFAPVGQSRVAALGTWSSGVAWSTIKVPLAIAALRTNRPNARALAAQAITASDNGAAEQLWSELGPPAVAAQQVQAVLREGGDGGTVVESRRLRPGFTAFGQTQWPLARQAQFAAHLPCIAGAGPVINLMSNIVGSQRWGLAGGGAPAKGGWGPGPAGGHLVRQFGVVSTPTGQLGVALAAEPRDGTFESGVRALNQMADWTAKQVRQLPGGRCSG